MLEYHFEDSGGSFLLGISGELTLENIPGLRNALLERLDQDGNITINLEKIGAVDISFIQLLCSAHRTALSRGKSISLSSYPEPFMKAIKDSGLCSFVCRKNGKRTECMWPEPTALRTQCQ